MLVSWLRQLPSPVLEPLLAGSKSPSRKPQEPWRGDHADRHRGHRVGQPARAPGVTSLRPPQLSPPTSRETSVPGDDPSGERF